MNQKNQYLKIAKLIASELNKSITEEDSKYLDNWINESAENKNIYNEIKKDNWYASNLNAIQKYNLEEGWKTVKSKINVPARKSVTWRYAAAAAVVVILASGYFFRDNFYGSPIDNTSIIVNSTIEIGTDKATLTLEDGLEVTLEKGTNYQTANVNSNGEEIVYSPTTRSKPEIAYNYLTIPRGGQFHVKLSDGTEVWLNSESRLKYPVAFMDGETRQVELVYGEAYFDVSPSTENKGAKFKVLNKNQEVEVLGTEFNIKAYKEEDNVYTTLVEGKVTVSNSVSKEILLPNQQSKINISTKAMSLNNVDIYSETSWRKGFFSFKGKTLKEIMIVLSRWYDIQVEFENKELEKVKFNGVLSKHDPIEEILTSIKNTDFITAYEITDKIITIK